MKTFIFDLDDTLIRNQYLYVEAQDMFADYILKKLGSKSPSKEIIVCIQESVGASLVKSMGFSVERLSESFIDAYKIICDSRGYNYSIKEINEVSNIGDHVRDIVPKHFLGVSSVLDFLKENQDELILYTKGCQKMQQKKIEVNGLDRWFTPENIYIAPDKTVNGLAALVGDRNKDNVFMVGNSVRSDIEPALAAGINAIHIPFYTWSYENGKRLNTKDRRLSVIRSLPELIDIYEGL